METWHVLKTSPLLPIPGFSICPFQLLWLFKGFQCTLNGLYIFCPLGYNSILGHLLFWFIPLLPPSTQSIIGRKMDSKIYRLIKRRGEEPGAQAMSTGCWSQPTSEHTWATWALRLGERSKKKKRSAKVNLSHVILFPGIGPGYWTEALSQNPYLTQSTV